MTVEFLDLVDLQGLMEEHGEKILGLVHSQILAHNFRGQHRATDKEGEFLRGEDHVYSVAEFIKGSGSVRTGWPTVEDTNEARKLRHPLLARCENGETPNEALAGMVKYHAGKTSGWTYEWEEELETLPLLDELAVYCRAYRLFVAKSSKAGGFR